MVIKNTKRFLLWVSQRCFLSLRSISAKRALARIITPIFPEVDFISFTVMIITVMVNVTVMIYEYRRGKQLQSDILIVDSMHTRGHIFISLSVIVALICVKLGFPIVDPVITLDHLRIYRLFRVHHHTGKSREYYAMPLR